jgi:hypothetical protein
VKLLGVEPTGVPPDGVVEMLKSQDVEGPPAAYRPLSLTDPLRVAVVLVIEVAAFVLALGGNADVMKYEVPPPTSATLFAARTCQ